MRAAATLWRESMIDIRLENIFLKFLSFRKRRENERHVLVKDADSRLPLLEGRTIRVRSCLSRMWRIVIAICVKIIKMNIQASNVKR